MTVTLTATLSQPTGITAQSTAFGIAVNPGQYAFGSMPHTNPFNSNSTNFFQQSIASIGGVGCIRVQSGSITGQAFPTLVSAQTGSGADLSVDTWGNLIQALQQMNYTGRVIMGMGQTPSWLTISNTTHQAAWGNMALQMAQYFVAQGYPITWWETINEADINNAATSSPNWGYCAAMNLAIYTSFQGAGAPYNSYIVGGPVAGYPITTGPGNTSTFISTTQSTMGSALGFLTFHDYICDYNSSYASSPTTSLPAAIDPTIGYGASVAAVRAAATGSLPVLVGEININGTVTTSETDQQTAVGAVYAALALLDGVQNGNMQMGAWWLGYDDFGTSETYGMINTTSTTVGGTFPAWNIFPCGWTIGRLFSYMPGSVVATSNSTSATASASSLYTMATLNGNSWCMAIVNYSTTTAQTANVVISPMPGICTYYEVSPANLMGFTASKTAQQLTSLNIPATSVIILNGIVPPSAPTGGILII